jgi:hypothetical protein
MLRSTGVRGSSLNVPTGAATSAAVSVGDDTGSRVVVAKNSNAEERALPSPARVYLIALTLALSYAAYATLSLSSPATDAHGVPCEPQQGPLAVSIAPGKRIALIMLVAHV